jgi:hypothetical protein
MILITKKNQNSILDINILKAHLRIDHDYEDEYLKILIDFATDVLEKAIGVSIMHKKYKYIGPKIDKIPIRPILKVHTNKDDETIFTAGIAETQEMVPIDLKYAVMQISKNMYENNDENILESKYIKHIVNNYKQFSFV